LLESFREVTPTTIIKVKTTMVKMVTRVFRLDKAKAKAKISRNNFRGKTFRVKTLEDSSTGKVSRVDLNFRVLLLFQDNHFSIRIYKVRVSAVRALTAKVLTDRALMGRGLTGKGLTGRVLTDRTLTVRITLEVRVTLSRLIVA
jgi:hypothetical protein